MKSLEQRLPTAVGTVTALRRYPVKSMQGEAPLEVAVTRQGIRGDRAFALVDVATGKVASAKNPRRWPQLLACRAGFVAGDGDEPNAVRITLPDGATLESGDPDASEVISRAIGRSVLLTSVSPVSPTLEEYWPDIAELPRRDVVTDEAMPEGTFFDCALVHVLTTATLRRLAELYPAGRWEITRFRPNIVVDAADGECGFVENAWIGRTLRFGRAIVKVTGGTPRCTMTTLAQEGLPADTGILRAAAQHNEAHVGVYATVVAPGGIREGDAVTLVA